MTTFVDTAYVVDRNANVHLIGKQFKTDLDTAFQDALDNLEANFLLNTTDTFTGVLSVDGSVLTDTVNEFGVGNGVTIEGNLHKDSKIGIGNTSPHLPLSFSNALATAGTANCIAFYSAGTDASTYGIGISAFQIDYVSPFNHAFWSGAVKQAVINATGVNISTKLTLPTSTPASASATGLLGTVTWDSSYIYVCTATDTWKRVAIATW